MDYIIKPPTLLLGEHEQYMIVKRYDNPTPGWYFQAVKLDTYEMGNEEHIEYEATGLVGWAPRGFIEALLNNTRSHDDQQVFFRINETPDEKLIEYVWSCVVPIEWKTGDPATERVCYLTISSEPDPRLVAWLDS